MGLETAIRGIHSIFSKAAILITLHRIIINFVAFTVMPQTLDAIRVLLLAWAALPVAAFVVPTVGAATTVRPLTRLCPIVKISIIM